MARFAAIASIVALALGAAFSVVPFALQKRQTIAATPSLGGLFSSTNVKLPPRRSACVGPVPFDRSTQIVQFLVGPASGRPSPLEIVATAPGYVARGSVEPYPPAGVVQAHIAAPPRYIEGDVCIRNRGRRSVTLVGTTEPRSQTFAATRVGGRVQQADVALTLLPRKQQSLAAHMGAVLHHGSALTGGLAPVWLLWVAAMLFLVALPIGAVTALVLSMRAT